MPVRKSKRGGSPTRKRPAPPPVAAARRRVAASLGAYRSGFEAQLAARLKREGVPFLYEDYTYPIELSVVGHKCLDCGSKRVGRSSVYTPDFFFARWIIEAKGRFTARDRKRVLALLQTPSLKGHFGMLFMRMNRLSKTSKTTYGDWCDAHEIPWAVGYFKGEWLT